MLEIRCDTANNGTGKGHLLARVQDGAIDIWCVKCRTWHSVAVADLVRSAVADLRCMAQDSGEPWLLG